jgi:NTP pyrophosphatase (non-canonical NTP hydrolase)
MPPLTLKDYQATVDEWVKTHGVRYFSEMTNLGILVEEVGEVARLMVRIYGEQSFKNDAPPRDLADELADVMFVLTCIANQTGIDLSDALKKNLTKKTRRDSRRHWNNPKLSGGRERNKAKSER